MCAPIKQEVIRGPARALCAARSARICAQARRRRLAQVRRPHARQSPRPAAPRPRPVARRSRRRARAGSVALRLPRLRLAARRGDAETGKTGGVPPRLRLRQATRGLSRLTRSSRRRRDRSRQPSPEAHGSPAALPSARHASLRRVATPCRYAASLRRVATRPRVWAAGATLPCRRDAPARQAPGVGERGCRAAQTLLGCAESRGLGPVCCETSGCAGHGLARTDTD